MTDTEKFENERLYPKVKEALKPGDAFIYTRLEKKQDGNFEIFGGLNTNPKSGQNGMDLIATCIGVLCDQLRGKEVSLHDFLGQIETVMDEKEVKDGELK